MKLQSDSSCSSLWLETCAVSQLYCHEEVITSMPMVQVLAAHGVTLPPPAPPAAPPAPATESAATAAAEQPAEASAAATNQPGGNAAGLCCVIIQSACAACTDTHAHLLTFPVRVCSLICQSAVCLPIATFSHSTQDKCCDECYQKSL